MSAPGSEEVDRCAVAARAEATPLRTVLARLGLELETLHALSETVQDAVSELARRAPPDPQASLEMQGLDSLTQHLCALAIFVNGLASTVPAKERVELSSATSGIQLGLLRARLAGGESLDRCSESDIEIF